MNRITRILCLFMLITHLFGVGEAGAIFLLIAPGAGPAGTGEANVARSDDAYASWYNPAGLGFQTGREVAGMHVNWLPNLADDLYYEFLAYKHNIPNLGTFGGHVIFLSLGEQMQTDAEGNELGTFSSNMWALTTSFGTTLSKTSSIGLSFKILQQNLAPTGAGSEDIEGSSTDFAFDVGYLKKYSFGNFGVAVTNIGPKIWFMDQSQSDPAPTNMRIGFLSKVYDDGFNKVNLILDANKILVARYQKMDWNGDGIISGDDELAHDDPWYTAVFTAWLDDWYFGGDYDLDDDNSIGGWYWDDVNGNGEIDEYATELSNVHPDELDIEFRNEEYGIYGDCSQISNYSGNPEDCKEKGSGDDRTFSTELKEMIYNMGAEYWYTDNFVLRGGYIYDQEGKITNPTFGAGIRFAQYGFDFGYTAGEQGHPRANTMFFSVNIAL